MLCCTCSAAYRNLCHRYGQMLSTLFCISSMKCQPSAKQASLFVLHKQAYSQLWNAHRYARPNGAVHGPPDRKACLIMITFITFKLHLDLNPIKAYCSFTRITCSLATPMRGLHLPEHTKTAIVTQSHSTSVASDAFIQEAASCSMGISGGISCSPNSSGPPHLPHLSFGVTGSGHGQIAPPLKESRTIGHPHERRELLLYNFACE